ncbi:MAG: FxDxF family PEP-CTERM protein [Nitrosomonas sp.]|nr:MAG: FxDxF family PEP-CTERM protein [Nitrosomonas sp.]
MNKKILANITALVILGAAGSAYAALTPDSYNMLNGNTGSYNYWDETYSGAGCVTCDNAVLSGGRGDLTDGIIAADNWFVTEAPAGNGPYVGWTLDPTITFHWNAPVNVSSVTFHFDDSNGSGGVSAPASVDVNGINFPISDPAGSAPFAFVANGLSFTGNDLSVTIHRSNAWVFLSEVEFNVTPVPEPETYAMLLAGLGLIGFTVRRRKAAAV